MNKLTRGIIWGAVLSGITSVVIIAVVPIINYFTLFFLAVAIIASMAIGIMLNIRAKTVLCQQGHSFVATSDASRCPDCGQRYSEIKKSKGVGYWS